MPNPLELPLMKIARTIVAIKGDLIDAIGVEALRFIDDNFKAQVYMGSPFRPWPERKIQDKKRPGRAILVDTGALRRSIKKEDSTDHTTISTDIPYARIHNEGGDIKHPYREVTLNFGSYKGVDYEIHGKKSFGFQKAGTEAQQRKITKIKRASIYAHTTKMPRRQFIPTADSPAPLLTQRCEAVIIRKITTALK